MGLSEHDSASAHPGARLGDELPVDLSALPVCEEALEALSRVLFVAAPVLVTESVTAPAKVVQLTGSSTSLVVGGRF